MRGLIRNVAGRENIGKRGKSQKGCQVLLQLTKVPLRDTPER